MDDTNNTNNISSIKNFKNIFIALAILAVGGALFYFQSGLFVPKNLTKEQATAKAIEFINQKIDQNVTASLIEATDEGQVYGIHLKIGDTEYKSYITKDGKFLFPNGFILETKEENAPN